MAPAFTNIQWRTYIIFGVFCFVMLFHIFFLYPETQGLTLEEIDAVFDSNIPAWRSNAVKRGEFEERVRMVSSAGIQNEKTDARPGEERQEVV